MYIQKVIIENIRSISHFEMDFPNPAGWHVLIGDNGTGKTTALKAIGLGVLGKDKTEIEAFIDKYSWVTSSQKQARINISILADKKYDDEKINDRIFNNDYHDEGNINLVFHKILGNTRNTVIQLEEKWYPPHLRTVEEWNQGQGEWKWEKGNGWFALGFGINRDFSNKTSQNQLSTKAANMLSLFDSLHSFVDNLSWLSKLKLEEYEQKNDILTQIIKIVNHSDLLPNGIYLDNVTSEGVHFKNPKGEIILIQDLSNGYISVLSLAFEIIRQLITCYGEGLVFYSIKKEDFRITLPGVVLIDEIDAHLHPTWQTRIGQWFTQYFPNIQFIVTTHSPLICRACEKGSIWRLAAPDSEIPSGEIVGTERERLIYGNILDAYSTEAFGQSPVRSEKSNEKLQRLGELNMRAAFGKITAEEEKERQTLQQIFQTDVTVS